MILIKKLISVILSVLLTVFSLASCGYGFKENSSADNRFDGGFLAKQTIRILSGSENKELEDILKDCAEKKHIGIEITYKGSVDIMNELKNGADDYDAVWPASSMWLVKDFEDEVDRFEKKIYDLELSRTIAVQTAPQIKMI